MPRVQLLRDRVMILFDEEAVASGRDYAGKIRGLKNTDELLGKVAIVVNYPRGAGSKWPKRQFLDHMKRRYGMPERLFFSVERCDDLPQGDFLKVVLH